METIRAADTTDPATILTQLITFLAKLKPALNRNEAFLIERAEADLKLILAEGFDQNNATQAHRLYLSFERLNQLPETTKQIQIQTEDAIQNLVGASKSIQTLQTQQHASFIVILNMFSKLSLAHGLSVHEQQRLVRLEMKILNTFKQPDLSPDDKLQIIVNEMRQTSNAKGMALSFFTASSQLNNFLKEIIASLPHAPSNRSNPSNQYKGG